MKAYVDELPEDCLDCPCECEYYCNLIHEDVGCLKCGEIHKDCPLQSLADHDKQVRKEVVQEIKNKLKENGLLYTWKGEPKYKTMEELLDKIQGEN